MKILIELPTWLGDCIMATPSIENLIRKYPKSDVTFIGSKVAIELMKDHPNCFAVYELEKSFFGALRTFNLIGNFDLFFSYRGSYRTKFLKFFLRAKNKFQYRKKKYPSGHQVEKYNTFINECISSSFLPSKLKIYKEITAKKKVRPILGINPGATYGSAKCWLPESFARVAINLSEEFDIVIFGGNNEIETANEIEVLFLESGKKNLSNLAGKTSIDELVKNIASVSFFLTGDSGPMHIASALQIPTISIFGPTKEIETCQWMNKNSLILKKNLECQPCMKRICPLEHHNCMKLISHEQVTEAIRNLSGEVNVN